MPKRSVKPDKIQMGRKTAHFDYVYEVGGLARLVVKLNVGGRSVDGYPIIGWDIGSPGEISFLIDKMIEDLVKIKQDYTQGFPSRIEWEYPDANTQE